MDAETLEVTQRDADQRPVEAIAHDILQAIPAASLDEAEDRAALITLCKAVATAGDFPTPGLRDMAWAGSPVASARFV